MSNVPVVHLFLEEGGAPTQHVGMYRDHLTFTGAQQEVAEKAVLLKVIHVLQQGTPVPEMFSKKLFKQ